MAPPTPQAQGHNVHQVHMYPHQHADTTLEVPLGQRQIPQSGFEKASQRSGSSPHLQSTSTQKDSALEEEMAQASVIPSMMLDRMAIRLGLIILGWYFASSLSNNLSKAVLVNFPHAMTLTVCQFGFLAIFGFAMSSVLGTPSIPFNTVIHKILPLSCGHILAHFFTAVSLGNVPVSFTHTIKATSPIFAVVLSGIFLKERYTNAVVISLVPIVGGVILSTMTEVSYNFIGFATALSSTFIFCCQNIYSKKLFREHNMNHISVVAYTSLGSFCLMLPVALLTDDGVMQLIFMQPANFSTIITLLFANGFCHFLQTAFAFTALHAISPLTYSVANTFKRIFVITSSILWFGNVVAPLNALGILLAITGVGMYNKARYDQKVLTKKFAVPRESSQVFV